MNTNIYVVRATESGRYKIGVTSKPLPSRLSGLQVGSPEPLELVAAVPGDEEMEKRIHASLKASRLHGEWFKPTDEVVALVDQLRTLGGPVTLVEKVMEGLEDPNAAEVFREIRREFHRDVAMVEVGENDPRYLCVDCFTHEDYYIVHDEVWAQSGLDPHGGLLCIGCLESRIGRQLTGKDFPPVPINVRPLFQHVDRSRLSALKNEAFANWTEDEKDVLRSSPYLRRQREGEET